MLYDLFFAFLQTGRYREARKIIEVKTQKKLAMTIGWTPKTFVMESLWVLFFLSRRQHEFHTGNRSTFYITIAP